MIVRLGGWEPEEALVEGRAMMAQLGFWSWRRCARGARHAKLSGIEALHCSGPFSWDSAVWGRGSFRERAQRKSSTSTLN